MHDATTLTKEPAPSAESARAQSKPASTAQHARKSYFTTDVMGVDLGEVGRHGFLASARVSGQAQRAV